MKLNSKCLLFLITLVSLNLSAVTVDKVIGNDDLRPVNADAANIPIQFQNLVNAFGRLSMDCTGTHLGNGYVITAGHCFWSPPTLQRDLKCDDVTIEWGLRKDAQPYLISKCEKIVFELNNGNHDFAIIKVFPVPPVAILPDLNRRAVIGDTITIFSHPDKEPLQWAGFCGLERKVHGDLPTNTIQHKCDTKAGSSGAALINVLNHKIIGIHNGGVDGFAFNKDPDLLPQNTGMNYGSYVLDSPLYEALKELGFE
jgi:V8-like Glu-specific endopeptidase